MLALWLVAFSLAAASGQSTADEVNANYYWYCVAWQNTEGTLVPPDQVYNLVSLTNNGTDYIILAWNGDAPQPSLSDLETLSPDAAGLVQWQYSIQQVLQSQQLQVLTGAQIAAILQPMAGMLVFNSDTGKVVAYSGSAWDALSFA